MKAGARDSLAPHRFHLPRGRTGFQRATWWLVPPALAILPATAAHAQRVPDEIVWSAGAALFAPFVAVPIKRGILALLGSNGAAARLWTLSATEWLLWFPVAIVLIRFARSSSVPLLVALLFAAGTWLHRARVAGTSWRSALLLALVTPVLALLLPVLAVSGLFFVEWLSR